MVLARHMVRHEVYDYLQIGLVTAFYQVGEFFHSLALVLTKIRVNVIVIGDSVWTTCFAFDNGRSVVLRSSMTYHACVPHMRSAQVADSAEGFGSDGVKGATTIFLQRTIMTACLVVVGKGTRQQLINNRFQGSVRIFYGEATGRGFPIRLNIILN